eukprot:scaffold3437_cov31-Tisochrysis_lutea.AAC.3
MSSCRISKAARVASARPTRESCAAAIARAKVSYCGLVRERAATTRVRRPSRAKLPTSSSIQSDGAMRSAITDSAPFTKKVMAPLDSSRSSTPIRLSSEEKGISCSN